jgi:hypothetical protein
MLDTESMQTTIGFFEGGISYKNLKGFAHAEPMTL